MYTLQELLAKAHKTGVAFTIRGEDKQWFSGGENSPHHYPPVELFKVHPVKPPPGTPDRGDVIVVRPLDLNQPTSAYGVIIYDGIGCIDIPIWANVKNVRIELSENVRAALQQLALAQKGQQETK